MKTSIYLFIAILVLACPLPGKGQDTLNIQVTAADGTPLMETLVLQLPEHYLLGTTDQEGWFRIARTDMPADNKTIRFRYLGFSDYDLPSQELKTGMQIRMQEKMNVLPESVVHIESLPNLLEKSWKKTGARYNGKKHCLRYSTLGNYARAIESQGKTIHLRHEHGLFLTTGNNKRNDKWDMDYYDSFIPIYCARSYQLTSSGKDTLKYDYMTGSPDADRNYIAENTHLFEIMRAIYLYAPLLDDPNHFDFHFVGIDSADYTLGFVSRQQYLPKKTKMLAKGTLKIDRESLRMKSIDFESMDLQYFFLTRLTAKNPVQSPCLIRAKADFRYDGEGHAYISQCTSEVVWKAAASHDKRIWNGFLPARPKPAKNRLVEKEYWACGEYKPVSERYKNETTCVQAGWAAYAPAPYDPKYFSKHPNPFATPESTRTLEQYMPLEQQYRNNSNRNYSGDNDYRRMAAKKILFDLFLKPQP